MAFTTFVAFQLFNALNARSERASVFRRHTLTNGRLWGALGAVAALQVAVVHLPVLGTIFDTVPLRATEWAVCGSVAVTILVVDEVRKLADAFTRTSRRANTVSRAAPIEDRHAPAHAGSESSPDPDRGRCGGQSPAGWRTTTTGHGAWSTTCWLTDPSSRPLKPPRPREPTTTRSASEHCSSTAVAPLPTAATGSTSIPSSSLPMAVIMASTVWRAARSYGSGSGMTAAGHSPVTGGLQPQTTRSGARRSRASAAANRKCVHRRVRSVNADHDDAHATSGARSTSAERV